MFGDVATDQELRAASSSSKDPGRTCYRGAASQRGRSASGTNYRAPLTTPVTPVAPSITTHPNNSTVTAPTAAGMTVIATGTQLTYVWQRQPAGGGWWSTVGGVSGPTLTAATSIADDGASYRCQVSNAAGSATSNAAVLTVLPPPPAGGGGSGGGGGGGGGCGLGSGLAALLLAIAGMLLLNVARASRP